MDGSTKPEIKDFLSKAQHPYYRSWISEPDKGISDAWNKGIKRATGDIIHIQNSGDFYFNQDVLSLVENTFRNNPEIKWLHGQYAQHKGGIWVISGKSFDPLKLYRGFRTVGHPTMFIKKELYKKHGLFDLDLKIAMDYDFLVRIANEKFAFIEEPLAVFTPGGQSNNLIKGSMKEMSEIYTKYKGYSFMNQLGAMRIRLLHQLTGTGFGKWLFKLKNSKNIPSEVHLPENTGKITPGKLNDNLMNS